MSADRQRLKSAIQRIAKDDPEIRNLLGEGQNKGGKPSSSGVGTSEAESDRQCCDGSVSSNANPGTSERDPDDGGCESLSQDEPADIGCMGDGTLSGVTDCDTGEPICFDGAGFIPPEGWDDPQSPPFLESYEEGFYWSTSSSGTCRGATVDAYHQCTGGCGFPPCCFERVDASTYEIYDSAGGGGDCSRLIATVLKFSCTGQHEDADYCNPSDDDILEDSWPEDGCTNLAIKGGKIVGSKYDPENDGSYSAPRDSIDLCSGDDQISLAPSADGGWKTINSTTNNGYLYDSSGRQIAHIDGSEYSDPSV